MPVKVQLNTLYTNGRDSFRVVVAFEPGKQVCYWVDPEGDDTPFCCSVRQIKRWSTREATAEEIASIGWEPLSDHKLAIYDKAAQIASP